MSDDVPGRVRELVGDLTKAPVLHGLLQDEATGVIAAMRDDRFNPRLAYSKDELAGRVAAYEAMAEALGRAAALVAYWIRTSDERLIPTVVTRLANALEGASGTEQWWKLRLYPSVLVLYAAGLAAVIGHREEQLASLLRWRSIRTVNDGLLPLGRALHLAAAMDHRTGQDLPGPERRHTPVSDHLCGVLQPWLEELEPDPVAFERAFDRWEYLAGLVIFDFERVEGRGGWAPVGRLSWRGEYGNGIEVAVRQEIEVEGASWPLLRGGMFGGDLARLTECATAWDQWIAEARRRQF